MKNRPILWKLKIFCTTVHKKCFHLKPFWSVKHWFFEKKSKMYRFFDRFFRVKLGPIEQHNRKFFLKDAIKHQLMGSWRTTLSAKILGDPQEYLCYIGFFRNLLSDTFFKNPDCLVTQPSIWALHGILPLVIWKWLLEFWYPEKYNIIHFTLSNVIFNT